MKMGDCQQHQGQLFDMENPDNHKVDCICSIIYDYFIRDQE